jgi:PKD repeat protein
MNNKILLATAFFYLLFILSSSTLTGQSTIRFKPERASEGHDALYKEHFSSYSLATLETRETTELLRSSEYFNNLQIETPGQVFSVSLQPKDLRPAHYKLRVADDKGIHEMPRSPNTTYFGYTKEGHYDVRITANLNFFNAMIITATDEFFIEPARNIVPGAPKELFVMYWQSNNRKKFTEASCGVDHDHIAPHHLPKPSGDITNDEIQNRMSVCKVVQVALANDFEMFQEKGSVSEVEDHNMAVINNVLTNYDDEFTFDIQFDIVEIFVAASSGADPWTNSNSPNALLDDFTDWGPNGFDNMHDVASLWTNREFSGDVIGLAWLDAVCTSFRYNTVQDFTNNAGLLRCLQAHELGHNFAAGHDASGSNTIMAPSVSNTNNWSTQSINQINAFMDDIGCLSNCGQTQPPVADFSADETEGCTPFVVNFSDESTNNPTSWSWTFEGGTPPTSTSANPTVTYNSAGTFNVSLTVTNSQGSDNHTINNYITVLEDPVADFDYTINDLEVDFENNSENADSYFWEFGDGGTSSQANPLHEYDEDGIYTVTLEATNDCGTDIFTVEIEIISLPEANFTASPTQGCEPFEVEFNNFSSDNADAFEWEFPGGSPPSSTAFEPVIVYEIPGTYSVTLTAINDAGDDVFVRTNYITVLPQPSATFTFVVAGLTTTFNSNGSVGTTYSWSFGDGETSNLPNPVHVYEEGGAYNVTLTVSNSCGTEVTSSIVTVIDSPVAGFSANLTEGCAPLVVQFINESTGIINSYSWVFEGGSPSTSNQPSPTVTYHNPGTFDVTLTVTNAIGSDVQFNANYITVHSETVSGFDFVVSGLQVSFINESANSSGSVWNFGDGLFGDEENPVHTYASEGIYNVMLISEGVCGDDTSFATITLQSSAVADFTILQSDDCVPATVEFTNQSSENATGFKWTFEGGTPATSTQENPTVIYNTAGSFDVELIVFAPAGNDTILMENIVTIGSDPAAAFLFSTSGTTVEFENLSSNANSFEWNFGDGDISLEQNPSHTYAEFGTYLISLIATNDCGNDTFNVEIVLGTVPNASFSFLDHSGCAPFEVQFIDQSQNNPTAWLWMFEGGEPATSNLQNPVVIYNDAGDYTVSLQVTNGNGTDVLVLEDVIQIANAPDAAFDYDLNGNLVSLFYPGTDYDSLRWDFGDGRTDNSLNPTVEYLVPGEYVITLTVFNACGTDTETVTVNIITSTNDVDQNTSRWQIRPNPFEDVFHIYGEPALDGNVVITLMDIHGKVISKENWSYSAGPATHEMHSSYLPAGVIIVQIQDGIESVVLRGVHQD